MKRLLAATFIVALTTQLTSCFAPPNFGAQSGKSQKVIAELIKGIPKEFLADVSHGGGGGSCGIDYCDPNSGITFPLNYGTADKATICQSIIAFAKTKGLRGYYYDPEYVLFPYQNYEAQTQISCVNGNNFALMGYLPSDKDKTPWAMEISWGDRPQIHFSTRLSIEEGTDDPRQAFQTIDQAMAQVSSGMAKAIKVLNAIGTYRKDNPKAPIYDPKEIKKALKGVNDNVKLQTKNGKTESLYLPSDGTLSEQCISIKKFDPKYFGVDDPGSYYTENLAATDLINFGDVIWGEACRP